MNLDIKLHKEDLPDQMHFSDNISIDCEFMGLNVERDRLCLVQISSGNNDAHIIQLNKDNNQTFVIVTHSDYVGSRAHRIINMKDGEISK